ncbi:hypothetical protein FRC08_006111 [Ceratobasidium sp. 394]|nr:hypothetical protein FRC08_006111 [Ceratobasidium sp. 394]
MVKVEAPKCTRTVWASTISEFSSHGVTWMEFNSVSSALENWPDLNRFRLCRQIAQAVGYIHNMNLVHGNIRGSSFFMGPDGTPKLTKFGHNIRHVPGPPLTNPSIRWMAPELFQDEAQKCCETDVFAMGVVRIIFMNRNRSVLTGLASHPDNGRNYNWLCSIS